MATKKSAPPNPPARKTKTETVVITAEQFLAGCQKLSAGFESLARIEQLLSPRGVTDSPAPRITEVPMPSKMGVQSDAAPLSVMLDDAHSRSSFVRRRAESLRDSIVHGIHPDAPQKDCTVNGAATPSMGPAKDAANWIHNNLAATEDALVQITNYLLNQ